MVVANLRAPEHLLSYSWLELEKNQALRVFNDLAKMVGKLDKKLTVKRVHAARVTLRRWYSVWDIMAIDGWEDDQLHGGGFDKTIGRQLKKLNKNLGLLRDLDVTLELARDLHLNQIVVRRLGKKRKDLEKKVGKKIAAIKLSKLIQRLRSYLAAKSEELQYLTNKGNGAGSVIAPDKNTDNGSVIIGGMLGSQELSAYFHLDRFLLQSEHQCQMLCEHSTEDEELHELRLSIKRWRYLLTEFFGLTNLELVSTQQILGKIRDLNRLRAEIDDLKKPLTRAIDRKLITAADLKADKELIASAIAEQFKLLEPLLKNLPFGLRPYLLSL